MDKDNQEYLVSVIVPVFNVEQYLSICLNSVINQKYKTLELIIIDDGSTDGSGSICDEYKQIDKRIKVFHTDNRGLSAARNTGLEYASGDFLLFLDSDDWLEHDAINKLVKISIETDAEVVCFRSVREYAKKKPSVNRRQKKYIPDSFILKGDDIIKATCSGQIGFSVWNKLWKKQLFEGIKFPEGRNYEDISTSYKALLKTDDVVCISDILYHYRARKGSITTVYNLKNTRDYWYSCYECYNDLSAVSEQYSDMQLRWCINAIGRMWRLYSGFTEKEKKSAKNLINDMQCFSKDHFSEVLTSQYIPVANKVLYVCTMTSSPFIMQLLYSANKIYNALKYQGNCFN